MPTLLDGITTAGTLLSFLDTQVEFGNGKYLRSQVRP